MKKPTLNENQTTKQIIEYLEWNGYRVWKLYNGGVSDGKGGYRKKPDKYKGVPDIVAIKESGEVLFVEVKREKGGKVSPEQAEFIRLVNTCNRVRGVIARNIEEVKE